MVETILTISTLSIIFAKFNPVLTFIKLWFDRKRIKPFDCEFCLSFWVSLIVYFTTDNHLIIIGVTPIFTYLLWRTIEKY